MGKIKQDKLLHLTMSALLAVVFGLFLPWWAAGLIALGIGIGKELWDKEHGGVPSWADFGAMRLMDSGEMNTGFTFSNPNERLAIVAIGPTTSNSEFLNTLVHEVHHLAVAIAESLGVDLRDEGPAYLSGDLAYELASVICDLGCSCGE